ncbi:MAG TPA: M56 family metallopeptidase [Mucilaginibacter sp.]|jgi:hypothetical protein|nr:M56 family metallopeptidase [Mucilaginibacter sp.]
MNWLYYLLEANLYLILFYTLYYLVLRRETWHQYNRAYLLGSSILAFIIPVLQLGFLKPAPTVVILPGSVIQSTSIEPVTKTTPIVQHIWNTDDYILAIYLAIAACLLTGLIIKIVRLVILSRKGQIRDFGKWKVVNTDMERGAFTFFNYLFVSADMAKSDTVIAHELVHIRQKHTWDIICLEIFRIVNWFNPAVYLLQRSMKELHEFIADEASAGSKEQIDTYTDFLVANAYGAYEHQLTNNLFNQSLLKKRIMMLHQKRSGSPARLKYLLVLPLLGGLLCASTLAFAKDYGWIDIAPAHAANIFSSPSIAPNGSDTGQKTNKVIRKQTNSIIRRKNDSIINDKANKVIHKQTDSAVRKTNKEIKGEIKSQIDQQKNSIAAIADTTMHAFYMQIARYTRYPAAARNNKVAGRVFAVFSVDENNNIINVGVLRSPDKVMSQEVVRVLKMSGDKFKGQIGVTYTLPVSFNIVDEQTGKYLDAPSTASNQDAVIPRDQSVKTNKNVYLNEVVVTTSLKHP